MAGNLQLFQYLAGGDPPDSIAFQQFGDGGFADALCLRGGRHEAPKCEEPWGSYVFGQFEQLRIVAPEKLAHPVAQTVAVMPQFLGGTSPFAQFDRYRENQQ